MAPRSRLSLARSEIIRFFDAYPKRVLRRNDIETIFQEKRGDWRLAQYTKSSDFIIYLAEETYLRYAELVFPQKKVTLYVWREASPHEVPMGLGPPEKTYLGYYTALALHELTEQIPKTIYTCIEQSSWGSNHDVPLTQSMIDSSFSKFPKVSSQIAPFWGSWQICIISSVPTNGLGVIDRELGRPVRITDIERTLIDIAVRPHYAGGVYEVLKAYQNASNQISVNRLRSYLQKLSYKYPFHQTIGFYLEKAGLERRQLLPLSSLPIQFDMPLYHGAERDQFSEFWRVWYPKDFA